MILIFFSLSISWLYYYYYRYYYSYNYYNYYYHYDFYHDNYYYNYPHHYYYYYENVQSRSLYRVAQKNRNSWLFRILLWSTVTLFHLAGYRPSFPHYNNTKIIKFGWELFILWVISYGLSKNGTVDTGLSFSPCWIEHLFLITDNTKIIKFGWKLFILWVILMDCHFRDLPLI